MQVSMFGQLSGAGTDSPIDACLQNLAQLRDEGFRRVWISQLPYEPDLLTILAVALREIDTIEVGSGVDPIQNQHPMQMAQRALTVSLASGGRFLLGLGMTHQAAADAGRPESEVRVVAALPVSVTDDVHGARPHPRGAAPGGRVTPKKPLV